MKRSEQGLQSKYLHLLDAVVAEVELFQAGAVLQPGHAGQPIALERQLPQRRQAAAANSCSLPRRDASTQMQQSEGPAFDDP